MTLNPATMQPTAENVISLVADLERRHHLLTTAVHKVLNATEAFAFIGIEIDSEPGTPIEIEINTDGVGLLTPEEALALIAARDDTDSPKLDLIG